MPNHAHPSDDHTPYTILVLTRWYVLTWIRGWNHCLELNLNKLIGPRALGVHSSHAHYYYKVPYNISPITGARKISPIINSFVYHWKIVEKHANQIINLINKTSIYVNFLIWQTNCWYLIHIYISIRCTIIQTYIIN